MAASKYLTLGGGEVHFAPFKPGTRIPGGYKFFGNCPEFNVNVSFEELTHMDSTRGLREEDASVMTSRSVTSQITCDEMSPQNLAWFFMGSKQQVTQSSGTATTETIEGVSPGESYQLGVTDSSPTGVKSITNVTVEDTGGAGSTYVLNTDYTVDADRGIVTILESGSIAEASDLDFTFDNEASSRSLVISGKAQAEGAIQFRAYNAEGEDTDYLLPYVKLRPTGDLALIGEDWVSFQFDVKGLLLPKRSVIYADGQPYV